MSVEPLNRPSRVAVATAQNLIPPTLVGLAVVIVGWIVMASSLRMVDIELLSAGGIGMGFCLVIGGLVMMLWAER